MKVIEFFALFAVCIVLFPILSWIAGTVFSLIVDFLDKVFGR